MNDEGLDVVERRAGLVLAWPLIGDASHLRADQIGEPGPAIERIHPGEVAAPVSKIHDGIRCPRGDYAIRVLSGEDKRLQAPHREADHTDAREAERMEDHHKAADLPIQNEQEILTRFIEIVWDVQGVEAQP